MMKTFLRSVIASDRLTRIWRSLNAGHISVLTLHRFRDDELGVVGHDLQQLAEFLSRLRKGGYTLMSLADAVDTLCDPISDSLSRVKGGVVFTIDDGYADVARAADVFLEYECPLTVFLTTGFVDGRLWQWWDKVSYICQTTNKTQIDLPIGERIVPIRLGDEGERASVATQLWEMFKAVGEEKKWRSIEALAQRAEISIPKKAPAQYSALTWGQARDLEARGLSFGPHTVTHPIMSQVSDDQSAEEIRDSWRVLREQLAHPVPLFAYPNGTEADFGPREIDILSNSEIGAAVTTEPGYLGKEHTGNRYRIPRHAYPDEGVEQRLFISSGVSRQINAARRLAGTARCVREVVEPFDVQVMFEDASRLRFETELLDAKVAMPLNHLAAWDRGIPGRQWFVAVRDSRGKARAGFAFEVAPSRAFPGQLILRCCRMRWHFDLDATLAAIEAIAKLVRRRWNVLRVHLELFEPQWLDDDPAVGAAVRNRLEKLGFVREAVPRVYERTAVIDLRPSEEEIFAAFHKTGRQNVRRTERHPVEIRPIYDVALGGRLNDLLREVMQRTGGDFEAHDWVAILRFSARYPRLSRVVGIFHTEVQGPESLVAFAWAKVHGDHAEYNAAAATRDTTLRISLAYAPAWELIRWAKACGCKWFDFGGITAGTLAGNDPLGGISDFKRYYTREIVTVGQEWILKPSKVRSNSAAGVSYIMELTRFRRKPMSLSEKLSSWRKHIPSTRRSSGHR